MLGPESLISHFLLSPLPIVLPKNHPSSSFLQHDDDAPCHSGNVEILGLHVLFVLAHEVLPHTFGMLTGELWKRVNALGTALHWRVPALKGGRVCSKWCKNWSRDILSVINCLGSGVMCRLACGRRLCAACTRRSTLSIWQRTIAGDMTFPWSLGITLLVGLCLFSL